MAGQPRIVVVGSANTDLIVQVPRLPAPGETVAGNGFRIGAGGKGANQAVAAARAGAAVTFVACVGDDDYGHAARERFAREGLGLDHFSFAPGQPSGVALITVADGGANTIATAGGANAHLTPDHVASAAPAIAGAQATLAQLETPLETVRAAAELTASSGGRFILNPAPARPLPDTLWPLLDIVTPNEHEAGQLTGIPVTDPAGAARAGEQLRRRGARAVVITLGGRGAWIADADGAALVPAFPVNAVDTTAAGDVFNAALAVALAEGRTLAAAARFANAAAALAVTRPGAQESAPVRAAIDRFLDEHP